MHHLALLPDLIYEPSAVPDTFGIAGGRRRPIEMEDISRVLLPLLLAVVGIVLVMGLWNMLRGGNPGRSQQLMRWRILLQFAAIVIAIAAVYFAR